MINSATVTDYKRDYPYWVGALEGAIKMALIELEYGSAEKAAERLRCVLAECEAALARPWPTGE